MISFCSIFFLFARLHEQEGNKTEIQGLSQQLRFTKYEGDSQAFVPKCLLRNQRITSGKVVDSVTMICYD